MSPNLSDLQAALLRIPERIPEEINRVYSSGLDDAAREFMRNIVDTTPSDLSARHKGNRNWTFNMRNRMDTNVDMFRRGARIDLGWFTVRSSEDYFAIQEYGGRVSRGPLQGVVVSPMHALEQATNFVLAREVGADAARRVVKEVLP